MSFLNTVRNFFTVPDEQYPYDDQVAGSAEYAPDHQPREGRVVSVAPEQKPNRLTIYSPKSFEEAQHPALDIKQGITTIVNFHRTNPQDELRISNFLSGVVFALNGSSTQVADKTLVFAPNHTGLVNRGEMGPQAHQQGMNSAFQQPITNFR